MPLPRPRREHAGFRGTPEEVCNADAAFRPRRREPSRVTLATQVTGACRAVDGEVSAPRIVDGVRHGGVLDVFTAYCAFHQETERLLGLGAWGHGLANVRERAIAAGPRTR